MREFDVVVIGAGPAGYVAALRCAQLGLETAVVDEWISPEGKYVLGGTCLNVGCIPSKALLDSSEQFYRLQHHIGTHGISVSDIRLDLSAMISRKNEIVRSLTGGIESLFSKNRIMWLKGHGRLRPEMRIEVTGKGPDAANETVEAKNIVIATGSVPRSLPGILIDGEKIVDSTGALNFSEVPKRLGVIGAGVIGLELGSVWNRLGSEAVLLEATERFLFFADHEIAKAAHEEFSKQGLDIRLGARVLSADTSGEGVKVTYEDNGGTHELEFDKLVMSVGRKPHTDDLNADEVGLLINESGFIHTEGRTCRTNLPGVYAVGDVVGGPMLAHKGSVEGVMVAERIAGQDSRVSYDVIPQVVYTMPEISWVGRTEEELQADGVPYKIGRFQLKYNGRAMAMEETAGMVKVIAHKETDELLGVHILGFMSSEIIAEAVVAMEYKGSAEDLARTVHSHPSLTEAIQEAALSVDDRALHG